MPCPGSLLAVSRPPCARVSSAAMARPIPRLGRDDTGGVTAAVTRRWRAIDPLLPAPSAPSGGCGAELFVTGPDGQPTAIGFCEHWHGGPGSMELTWGAASRFRLTAQARPARTLR